MLIAALPTNGRLTGETRWPSSLDTQWRRRWSELIERCRTDVVAPARAAGPEPDPSAERAVLERYAQVSGDALRLYRPAMRDVAWENARSIGRALREKADGADTVARAAYVAITDSFEEYLVLFDAAARWLSSLGADELERLAAESADQARQAAAEPESAGAWLLRWSVSLLVALDCVRDAVPPAELDGWAWRAHADALRVRAILAAEPDWLADTRRAFLRSRARTAWAGWDETETERELQPWPVPPA